MHINIRVDTDSNEMDFLIKVLIFKREVLDKDGQPISDSVAILKEVEQRLLENYKTLDARHKKHELLLFNPEKNNFYEAEQGKVHADRKTLLLIHGTFSSTKGSFKDIYGKDDYLKDLMKEVGYQQILAFDHPTVSYDAMTNSEVLFDMLNDLGIRQFTQAVDLMGTSQGGVIVQYLATLQSSPFKVGKAALVASAKRSGLLHRCQGHSSIPKILCQDSQKVGKAEAAMIAQLAQHSAEAFLKQPGMQMMTPGNPALNDIINGDFKFNPSFYPVVGDYSNEALKYLKLWKRALFRIFIGKKDQLPQWILGEYNDLVVGTREQFIIQKDYCAIPTYSPDQYRDYMEDAIHGKSIQSA